MKFLTKGGVRCISRSSRGAFIVCSGLHAIWVEVTGHDNSAADIMVYNRFIYLLLNLSYIIYTDTAVVFKHNIYGCR